MEGRKFDAGKPMWHLVPMNPLKAVVRVLTNAVPKYGENNWMFVDGARNRYYDAAMRHITDWFMGKLVDDDDKEPSLAHAICCLLFLMHFDERSADDQSVHRIAIQSGRKPTVGNVRSKRKGRIGRSSPAC